MKLEQGMILAAGFGKRMMPITKKIPKPLIKIGNVTLLENSIVILKEFGIKKTTIDTQGFRDLLDLVEQTCNDTWELYTDLQLYNPYTEEMVEKLKVSTEKLDNQLNELRNVADK